MHQRHVHVPPTKRGDVNEHEQQQKYALKQPGVASPPLSIYKKKKMHRRRGSNPRPQD